MTLLALLLANYIQSEIQKLDDPSQLRNSSSYVILQIFIKLYGKTESYKCEIAKLNDILKQSQNELGHFNLNPVSVYQSITGHKAEIIDKAMSNAIVAKVLNDTKRFLTKWALAYAELIFRTITEYPYVFEKIITY
ncbi:unnamed protein product [Thelazia callipaeda]|uniref:Uncharacterized protein n=1 Tax=Thelazia callipaeda TaxID=103827 RepID=A0A0N5D4T5_THECL|nr:unnamed protein product [Thelazia callipaeda]